MKRRWEACGILYLYARTGGNVPDVLIKVISHQVESA